MYIYILPKSVCLNGLFVICVKILKNIFKRIYFHPLLFVFLHLSIFNKYRELNVYLIYGTK